MTCVRADGAPTTADDVYLLPIAGAKVYIAGIENQFVLTDSNGRFTLSSAPVGDVKLVLNGMTATSPPPGMYFPEMVMDLDLRPGETNTVMAAMQRAGAGNRPFGAEASTELGVYLPRIRTAILQNVNVGAVTHIGVDAASAPELTDQQRRMLSIDIQPGSLVGPDGQPLASGQVGISMVPPELVRDMLPPGLLQHTFDITVQASGIANFSTPRR